MDTTSSSSTTADSPHRLSRRHVVLGAAGLGAAAAAATTLVGTPTGPTPTQTGTTAPRLPLMQAPGSGWVSEVGTIFRVYGGYRLRLAGVRAIGPIYGRIPNLSRPRAFVAMFDVLDGKTMAGDLTYYVQHPVDGWFQVFFSETDSRARMTAVFN